MCSLEQMAVPQTTLVILGDAHCTAHKYPEGYVSVAKTSLACSQPIRNDVLQTRIHQKFFGTHPELSKTSLLSWKIFTNQHMAIPSPLVILCVRRCNKNMQVWNRRTSALNYCSSGQEKMGSHPGRNTGTVERAGGRAMGLGRARGRLGEVLGWVGARLRSCRHSMWGFQYERHAAVCMLPDPKSLSSAVCCYCKRPYTAFSLEQACMCTYIYI